ncbi:hypothetical protein EPUS_01231 [Endocarpon pusillum Z07020]|uniref:Amidoligase enzyme n=1 Tax=Endocarpon pusillum (strain Z07020 / HMAS-L-300199) TaxID=1263415 RepID=U1HYC5_ENDPU|nr:uncharacterized protein EPUS_01231 [Endocarpon pusillum Z07020]ERF75865.1 hypothetical protein EPUS_01231 [Endocarpon pusillum Z07020]
MPLRSADKDDQEQLPNSETQGADASMATFTASAIEPARNQAQLPREPTISPSTQSRATLTTAGLLRKPSFDLRRRLAPLGALRHSGLLESSTSPYSSGLRSIKIGIETEFYLAGLQEWLNHTSLDGFTAILTRQHNQQVPVQHSRMQEYLRPYHYQGPYTQWCLVKEESLMSFGIPWGIELVSPLFRAYPGSRWREDVEATWAYLSANYDIAGNTLAGTHIHIGLEPDYSLTDLKRIAQAVIHFETAFEALVPRCRRGNIHVKSNWLDAPGLAQSGRSRPKSIDAIEKVICFQDLVNLLHPTILPSGQYDRSFSWNFCSWYGKRSVEFRKPPASLTSKDALSWTELAMSFVQASSRVVSSEELQKIPPTVGGLRWFLQNFGNEPGVNQPGRLERLWRSTEPGALLEPKSQVSGLPEQERLQLEQRLQTMVLADRRRIEEMIKTAQGVYC